MKKLVNYRSIIFLLLVATSQVKAQSVDVVIRENGTERKESIECTESTKGTKSKENTKNEKENTRRLNPKSIL